MNSRFRIETLRRRPPGKKVLVYLDQSALSRLAEGRHPDLLAILRNGVESDRLVCPRSRDHRDETALADTLYDGLTKLADELSMGIEFRSDFEIECSEIEAAAASFVGLPGRELLWSEAFDRDPHTSRSELYPSGCRLAVSRCRVDWMIQEVEYQKSGTDDMTRIYEVARATRRTFQEQAEMEYRTVLQWKLGTLIDPDANARRLACLALSAGVEDSDATALLAPGSAFRRYSAAKRQADWVTRLVRKYPELPERSHDFAESAQLRSCPSLAYLALLSAGIALVPNRKAKSGDRYDRSHLVKGLSRCDIVTADGGMDQVCREHHLVPDDVFLCRSSEFDALTEYLRSIVK